MQSIYKKGLAIYEKEARLFLLLLVIKKIRSHSPLG